MTDRGNFFLGFGLVCFASSCARYEYVNETFTPRCRDYHAARAVMAAADSAHRDSIVKNLAASGIVVPESKELRGDGYCSGLGAERVRKPWWKLW